MNTLNGVVRCLADELGPDDAVALPEVIPLVPGVPFLGRIQFEGVGELFEHEIPVQYAQFGGVLDVDDPVADVVRGLHEEGQGMAGEPVAEIDEAEGVGD